jgi:ATP-dependent RNA helicase DeaD
VVVATPGRAIDHLNRGTLPLDDVELVVLDEADEMLDMGFAEDIEALLQAAPEGRQTVLFSATMPPRIEGIAKRHLTDPERIQIRREALAEGEAPRVRQSAYLVARNHKTAALGRILDVESPAAAIVFCKTRGEVDELTETLNGRGYRAEALHGGMDQDQRDRVMSRLRSQTADLLVATDVAARGLDVEHLTHVVNFDVPSAPEAYVHRIGRVGRAGREGVAITLAEPRQRRLLSNIERLTRQTIAIEKIPTVADLQARQMELTLDQVRESVESGDLDRFRAVVDALSDEFDPVDVALAAVKLVHEASGATDDVRRSPTSRHAPSGPSTTRGRRARAPRGRATAATGRGRTGARRARARRATAATAATAAPARPPAGEVQRIYVGAGRGDGVRPQDLVGAIAGETHLRGTDIGAIRIFDRFALVEVPADAVDRVIDAMSATTIPRQAGGRSPRPRRPRLTDWHHGAEPEPMVEVRAGQGSTERCAMRSASSTTSKPSERHRWPSARGSPTTPKPRASTRPAPASSGRRPATLRARTPRFRAPRGRPAPPHPPSDPPRRSPPERANRRSKPRASNSTAASGRPRTGSRRCATNWGSTRSRELAPSRATAVRRLGSSGSCARPR